MNLSAKQVARWNRWRERYNPLRGLTIARAVAMLEAEQHGAYADLQWTYRFIEMTDEDLIALITRRTSAIKELGWDIKTIDLPDGDPAQTLADEQRDFLFGYYDALDNLYEAIEALAMASFRGFSILLPEAKSLTPIDPWNIARDGLRGQFYFNPEAQQVDASTLPAGNALDPETIVAREVPRPINRVGLLKFIRCNACQKDWDCYVEIYGIPNGVVTMPPNIPAEKEAEFRDAAEDIAAGGSGAIPAGATYQPNDSPRGSNPFEQHLRWLQARLILAGTGGMLTMLNQPTGIGGGQAEAHADTFKSIARAEARMISECLQKQIDKRLLARAFPGKKALAYFELSENEETDVSAVIDHAARLAVAGFQVDADELSEKTGYSITLVGRAVPGEPLPPYLPAAAVRKGERFYAPNASASANPLDAILAQADRELAAIAALPEGERRAAAQKLFEELEHEIAAAAIPARAPELEKAMQEALSKAVQTGLKAASKNRKTGARPAPAAN